MLKSPATNPSGGGGGGSGTVTNIATGAGLSGGPITTTGTIVAQWSAGAVATLGTGLTLGSGTLNTVAPLPQTASWVAGVDPSGVPMFIAPYACHVTGVKGRLETPEGAAATLRPVKAASGTAISAGTNLTSTTMNANGTAATNQTLTLSVTPADLVLASGDCIGLVSTGTWTTSVGALTVVVNPGTA